MMPEQQFKDQSTIFSIVPFYIFESKPGIYPGNFSIEACANDKEPSRLLVGKSLHLMTVGGRKEPIRIETASYQIAQSIVNDFLNGQLWVDEDSKPGICWIQGNISTNIFLLSHKDMYERMLKTQKNWFIKVIKETDNDWRKSHNSHVVTDHAKFAARVLGLKPEWMMQEEIALNFSKCPACNTMNDPQNAICTNCKCILNKAKYETLAFAK